MFVESVEVDMHIRGGLRLSVMLRPGIAIPGYVLAVVQPVEWRVVEHGLHTDGSEGTVLWSAEAHFR